MAVPNSQGVSGRLTAKLGPLPVWAWAAMILVGGYLAYRFLGTSSSTTTPTANTATDPNAPTTDQTSSGNPGPDQTVAPDVGQVNDQILSQLGGLGDSVDSLTQAVLTSSAFLPGTGDAGAGATVPLNGNYSPLPNSPGQRAVAPVQHPVVTTHTATKPKRTATPKKIAASKPRAKVKRP